MSRRYIFIRGYKIYLQPCSRPGGLPIVHKPSLDALACRHEGTKFIYLQGRGDVEETPSSKAQEHDSAYKSGVELELL